MDADRGADRGRFRDSRRVGYLRLIIPAKKMISAPARRIAKDRATIRALVEPRSSRHGSGLSVRPGVVPVHLFVGVIERPDFRVAEQPGDLLDRHPVIRQVTSGKALS